MQKRIHIRFKRRRAQYLRSSAWAFLLMSLWLYGQNDLKRIRIDNNAMVYVPQQDKIFIVTPGTNATTGNSLCVIDPSFGTIDTCYFIGSEPTSMAASDDGSFIYVGLRGSPRVVKFNLSTRQIDAEIDLGVGLFGPHYAENIAVLPGRPNSIVVSRMKQGYSPHHEGVAVFDDTLQRPVTTQGHTGSNSIAFAANGRLFGYNNQSSEFGLRELAIHANGVSELAVYTGLINYYFALIEAHENRLYSTNGKVINVNTPVPTLAGSLATTHGGAAAALEVSPDSNIIYVVLSSSGSAHRLERYHKITFERISSDPLQSITGDVKSFINWGTNGKLAFNTDKMVVIMRNCTSALTTPLWVSPAGFGGCYGEEITMTAPAGYNTYFWSTGATSLTATTNLSGQYFVQVPDSLGCLGPRSNTVYVEFDYPPFSTPWITGNSTLSICRGGSITLNAAGGGGNTYRWSNGATGPSVSVNQPGQYRVRAVRPNGCAGNYSLPVTVQLLPDTIPPRPVVEVEGNTALCNGESVALSAPEGYDSYIWSNAGITPSITVTTAGSYSVQVGNAPGCFSEPSPPVSVALFFAPPRPFIYFNGNLLTSSSPTGNQWFLSGEPIAGATEQSYLATVNGFYSVQVTMNGCASPMSHLHNHFTVGLAEWSENEPVLVFPNPAQDEVFIKTTLFDNATCDLLLYNPDGRMIQSLRCDFVSGIGRFVTTALPAGMYWLEIKAQGNYGRIWKKLIKI